MTVATPEFPVPGGWWKRCDDLIVPASATIINVYYETSNDDHNMRGCGHEPRPNERCDIQWAWWGDFRRDGDRCSAVFVNESHDWLRFAKMTITYY